MLSHISNSDLEYVHLLSSADANDLLRRIFFDILTESSTALGCNRHTLQKPLTAAVGLLIGASFYNSASAFAKGNTALIYMFGVSEVLVAATLNIWFLEELLKYIQVNNFNRKKTFKTLTAAGIVSLFASLPGTIISVKYNDQALYLAGVSFLGDVISNSFTFYRVFNPIFLRGFSNRHILIERFKTALIDRLGQYLSHLHNNGEVSAQVQDILKTRVHSEFWRNLLGVFIRESVPDKRYGIAQYLRYDHPKTSVVLRISAFIGPLAVVPALYEIVQEAIEKSSGSAALGISMGIFSSIPLYFCIFSILHEILSIMVDNLGHLVMGNFKKSYLQKNHPKVFYSSFLITSIISCLSFGTIATMIDTGISDMTLKLIMLPIAIALTVLLRIFIFNNYLNRAGLLLYGTNKPLESVEKISEIVSGMKNRLLLLPHDEVLSICAHLAEFINEDGSSELKEASTRLLPYMNRESTIVQFNATHIELGRLRPTPSTQTFYSLDGHSAELIANSVS